MWDQMYEGHTIGATSFGCSGLCQTGQSSSNLMLRLMWTDRLRCLFGSIFEVGFNMLLYVAAVLLCAHAALAYDNGEGATPPLGWNTWCVSWEMWALSIV